MKISLAFFLFLFPFSKISFAENILAHPAVQIEPGSVSISGISSGAYMSVQMGVIYSGLIRGVGIVSGGIFSCAEGQELKALKTCMRSPSSIDPAHYKALAEKLEKEQKITNLANLSSQKVFLFGSPRDNVNHIQGLFKLKDFFLFWNTQDQIKTVTHVEAGHGFPTQNYGHACEKEMPPWINNCGYDTAGEILQHLYGPQVHPPAQASPQSIFRISQPKPAQGTPSFSMADEGILYIPAVCINKKSICRLHVVLHGCDQSTEVVQNDFVNHAGYNEWAETNHIVILYPQTKRSQLNPKGCWDWWGYTGDDYATNLGKQPRALKMMIDDLIQKGSVGF